VLGLERENERLHNSAPWPEAVSSTAAVCADPTQSGFSHRTPCPPRGRAGPVGVAGVGERDVDGVYIGESTTAS